MTGIWLTFLDIRVFDVGHLERVFVVVEDVRIPSRAIRRTTL